MKKNNVVRMKPIAAAIAACWAMGGTTVYAQEGNAPVEEVLVTGIRASLERAMDIKRDSAGVVDAISAEDIGKFPDTNLAESLQRITGVSISRSNGEGSEITVRGFGPEYNMVTLNGRTMPTGVTYGGGSGADGTTRSGGSRAFNFANLASENVSGIQVYKTGRASVASGGIGATVNIDTTRPLEKGDAAAIGAKLVHDTTNRYYDDLTPELNGFVSMVNDEGNFGVALAASYQERDSGYSGVTVNNWNIGVWGEDDLYSQGNVPAEDQAEIVNTPDNGQLYARPNDFRYAFSDTRRDRINSQLTLQYEPTDTISLTMDYTYAKNHIMEERGEVTNWIQNGANVERIVFDDSAIATPIFITENYGLREDGSLNTVDVGYEQQYRDQTDTLRSFGFNAKFDVNDQLSFNFDAHKSSMESLPTGPNQSGEVAVGLGAPSVNTKTLDFSGDVPTYSYVTDVANNALTEEHVGSSIFRVRGAGSVNDVTQIKLDGAFELNDDLRFDFGVEQRTVEMDAYQTSGNNQAMGNWGIANPGELAGEGLLQQINIQSEFEDFNVGESPATAFRGNAVEIARFIIREGTYPGVYLDVEGTNAQRDILKEDVTALFAQATYSLDLAGMETNIVGGFRYEDTSVESTSLVNPIPYLVWEDNNDFSPGPAGATRPLTVEASYDNFLPSIDIDIAVTEDIKARISAGKTIGRAGYGDLRVATSNFGATGSSRNSNYPTANGSNPGLLPLESTNFDVSFEWYFDDASYASVGFFRKDVSNFIGTGQAFENHFGIRDQTIGPRAQAAIATLQAAGLATDDNNLFSQMVFDEHRAEALAERPDLFPTGEFTGTADQRLYLGEHPATEAGGSWDIIPNGDDPLSSFLTSVPKNERDAEYYGAEFAVQHFFGDTGFGTMFNYTVVEGEPEFNNLSDPTEDQFALPGLSDTANLVLMYENYGIQARAAYNWRTDFLSVYNQGGSRNPRYFDSFSQLDLNVSYDLTDDLSISLEGINVTGEDLKQYNRNERMVRFYDDLGARWQIGARYQF